MRALIILAAFAVALSAALAIPPVAAACIMSYCKDSSTVSTPAPSTSWAITNTHWQKVGDVYNPGHGRRVQIRDNSRRIIGYIEADGDITDKRRRKVGQIEELLQ